MKAFLMHPDRDFDARHPTPPNDDVLTPDLELSTLLAAMAAGDKTLFDVASLALLVGLREPNEIVYRQRILADCQENSALVRELYELAGEAIKAEKSVWGSLYRDSPRHVLSTAVKKMEQLVFFLKSLRTFAVEHAVRFRSPGFTRFFAMLLEELDDEYLGVVDGYLKELQFKGECC